MYRNTSVAIHICYGLQSVGIGIRQIVLPNFFIKGFAADAQPAGRYLMRRVLSWLDAGEAPSGEIDPGVVRSWSV